MKKFTKAAVMFLTMALCLGMFATMALAGTLTMSGSTTVQPVAELLKGPFNMANPDVEVVIAGGGSGVGINDVAAGSVNIGNCSRNLKDTDPAGLVAYTIGYDAVVVVVNPLNPVQDLTKDQVTGIFTGAITNWSEVGGYDAPIFVNRRADSSGTMDFFKEKFIPEGQAIVDTAKIHDSNGLMLDAVATDANAVGFLSMGYLNMAVKGINIDGAVPALDNAKSGAYPYVRPLNMVTNGEATDLAKAFIDYAQSPEGQAIVSSQWIDL
ncbi:MAG: Phosphate-binding protein PstS 1 precursor [Pelotomaculum sp. PtaU1.Bin035]|nr:MAG: Phosphate-binding protein PstS 1 precursor [Pelotomaculum sp. PtaU1.Bin035]